MVLTSSQLSFVMSPSLGLKSTTVSNPGPQSKKSAPDPPSSTSSPSCAYSSSFPLPPFDNRHLVLRIRRRLHHQHGCCHCQSQLEGVVTFSTMNYIVIVSRLNYISTILTFDVVSWAVPKRISLFFVPSISLYCESIYSVTNWKITDIEYTSFFQWKRLLVV